MALDAAELAHRLARDAEAVCRHYLSNGRREGRYWLVGDVRNAPGRSLFVRLKGPESGKGAAGKWTDAATGDHGDLLDVIRESCGLVEFRDVADEAGAFSACRDRTDWSDAATGDHRRSRSDVIREFCGTADFRDVANEARHFLSLPRSEPNQTMGGFHRPHRLDRRNRHAVSSPWRSRFRAQSSKRICANAALRLCTEPEASAFIPAATTARIAWSPTETWPAMIAAVTDLDGKITGAHRTWLDPSGRDKAAIDTPRRAMGNLLGNAVRFDVARDVMAAGEGIETMLSLRCVMPTMPMVAALSAAHLAAILFPATLRRLYIARDDDPAGDGAMASLIDRANEAGIEAMALSPRLGDFNEDLRTLGIDALRAALRVQIAPEDVARFMELAA